MAGSAGCNKYYNQSGACTPSAAQHVAGTVDASPRIRHMVLSVLLYLRVLERIEAALGWRFGSYVVRQ